MALVLDCSVTLPWYFEDERTEFTEKLLDRIADTEAWVPALWRLEFTNALLSAERQKRISAARRLEILDQASRLPFLVDGSIVSLLDISALAAQYRLSTYDAAYLELARRRGITIATLDAALVKAARGAGHPLLTDLSLYPLPKKPRRR